MNAKDVLKYGHLWVLKHLDGLSDSEWEESGVCGVWSVKDIIAHLASFECVLIEILGTSLGNIPTPNLDQFIELDGDEFNTLQVGKRKDFPKEEALSEYLDTQEQVMSLISRFSPETLRQPGTLPWYGSEYSLDDFIVYTFYGHKREHCAQIAVYRDKLRK